MTVLAAALVGTGAVALVGSLFLVWAEPEGGALVLFGAVADSERLFHPTGWQLLEWSDWVFVALAAVLLAVAALLARGGRLPLAVAAPLGVVCALGIASVVGHGLDPTSEALPARTAADPQYAPQAGPYVALLALASALAGLVLAGAQAARRTKPGSSGTSARRAYSAPARSARPRTGSQPKP